jgi:hypothetical protein
MDSDNRGPRLVAVCWSLAAAAAVLLFLRIYCKIWRGRGLWWDDHLLIVSWVGIFIFGLDQRDGKDTDMSRYPSS